MQPLSIAGIYEVCIGVADAIPQLQYWEQLGYRIGQIGELSASEARELYKVIPLLSLSVRVKLRRSTNSEQKKVE